MNESRVKVIIKQSIVSFAIHSVVFYKGVNSEELTPGTGYKVLDVCDEDYAIKIADNNGDLQWYGAEAFTM